MKPCFHSNTIVATDRGPLRISLIDEPMLVYSMDKYGRLCLRRATAAFQIKNAEIVIVRLSRGGCIMVAPDHKILAGRTTRGIHVHGEWIEAKSLKSGMHVVAMCEAYSERRVDLSLTSEFEQSDEIWVTKVEKSECVDGWGITVEDTHCLIAHGILAQDCARTGL